MFQHIEMQRLLQQIADVQTTTFIVKDLEHRFVLVNQVFADSLGLTQEQLIGKNDLEVGIPEHRVLGDPETGFPGFWALDDQAVASGRSNKQGQSDTECRTNMSHSSETLRTPLYDDDGQVVALLIQARDRNDIVILHEQLAQCQATLDLRNGHISTLNEVLTMLMSHRELEPLQKQLVQTIVSHTSASSAYLWMVHETGDFIEVVAGVGSDWELFQGRRQLRGQGVSGRVWHQCEKVFIEDAYDNVYTRPDWARGTQICMVPLTFDNDVKSVLMVGSEPDQNDLKLDTVTLEKIAKLASFAIANIQLVTKTQAELVRSRAMSDLSRLLSVVTDPMKDADAMCRILLEAIDTRRVSLYVADKNNRLQPNTTWIRTVLGVERISVISEPPVVETIHHWCFEHSMSATIARNTDDPRESAAVRAFRRKFDIGSTCCMPIGLQNGVRGVLVIARDRQQIDFNESEINVFRMAVNQLAAAMERHALSAALEHQAYHDSLTGLPNRRQFESELTDCLQNTNLTEHPGAVLFMDLDGFKQVNDKLGHAAGDHLLVRVGQRLAGTLKCSDTLARMGGDEFAVILRDVTSLDDAFVVAYRLFSTLNLAFDLNGGNVNIGTSIGISRFPQDGCDMTELLCKADTAMYQAKNSGKGRVLHFDQTLANSARSRLLLEFELREAIKHDQFALVYQPQVSCHTGYVTGVEALIRWVHPVRGLVLPIEFISVAEESGLIDQIGAWVLDAAVKQAACWKGTALDELRMGVNIAASQFLQPDFSDQVLSVLKRYGVNPQYLELEVTESVVLNEVESVVSRLQILRNAGVRIAIDDFGTGYSSLRYLQDLPLDVIKIDRSFVSRLQNENCDYSLINSMLLLASGLKLETIAEGVETDEQRVLISALGCDYIQGYYYSEPVGAEGLTAVVNSLNFHASAVVATRSS